MDCAADCCGHLHEIGWREVFVGEGPQQTHCQVFFNCFFFFNTKNQDWVYFCGGILALAGFVLMNNMLVFEGCTLSRLMLLRMTTLKNHCPRYDPGTSFLRFYFHPNSYYLQRNISRAQAGSVFFPPGFFPILPAPNLTFEHLSTVLAQLVDVLLMWM